MNGKWIETRVKNPTGHVCHPPYIFMRRTGRRWQCDCSRKWEITLMGGANASVRDWAQVCFVCDKTSWSGSRCVRSGIHLFDPRELVDLENGYLP